MGDTRGKITGLGGVFVKSPDREKLVAWYRDVLGFPYDGYGANFLFRDAQAQEKVGYNVWGPFKDGTDYFEPSGKDFMINLRVDDLEAFLEKVRAAGVRLVGNVETYDYGKFAWIVDPDGTKIELWEQVGPAPGEDDLEEEAP